MLESKRGHRQIRSYVSCLDEISRVDPWRFLFTRPVRVSIFEMVSTKRPRHPRRQVVSADNEWLAYLFDIPIEREKKRTRPLCDYGHHYMSFEIVDWRSLPLGFKLPDFDWPSRGHRRIRCRRVLARPRRNNCSNGSVVLRRDIRIEKSSKVTRHGERETVDRSVGIPGRRTRPPHRNTWPIDLNRWPFTSWASAKKERERERDRERERERPPPHSRLVEKEIMRNARNKAALEKGPTCQRETLFEIQLETTKDWLKNKFCWGRSGRLPAKTRSLIIKRVVYGDWHRIQLESLL